MRSLPMQSLKALAVALAVALVSLLGFVAMPSLAFANTSYLKPSEVDWNYQAETGPTHWADIDSQFQTCASGQAQSPIDLTAAEPTDLLNPKFHYRPVPLNLLNNGHTVEVPYAPGSYLTLEGKRYNLLQFHFHSPSEHAINGEPQIAELHLVHQSNEGELAVVAVLLKVSEEDASDGRAIAYTALSQNLPAQAGDKVRTGKTINAQSLLPTQTTTYRYSGSLTTPPCSESVTWLVMSQPVDLPGSQLAQYQKLLNHNNRPLQKLNQRAVQMDISA